MASLPGVAGAPAMSHGADPRASRARQSAGSAPARAGSAQARPPAAGMDGTCDESQYCIGCDRRGHTRDNCTFYAGKARGQHADARQPSAAEISADWAAGDAQDVVATGTVHIMDGSGLNCFFNLVLHGLMMLQIGIGGGATRIRAALAAFASSTEGRNVTVTSTRQLPELEAAPRRSVAGRSAPTVRMCTVPGGGRHWSGGVWKRASRGPPLPRVAKPEAIQ